MRMPFACLLLCATVVARADYQDLQIARTVDHVLAIHDYHGVLEQTGLFGTMPVVSEVAFRRPHDIRTRVTAPAELEGTITAYSPDELLVWSPRQELALRIRHLPPPDAAREGERIADAYRINMESSFYALGKVREVAGYPAIALDQRARGASQLLQSSSSQVYDDLSFPLAGSLVLRGGAKLEYRYRSMVFNDGKADIAPLPELPASTLVIDWDLEATARSETDVAARVPRALPFPSTLAGLPRARLLVHPDAVPAVAAWYRNDNYYLLVTASRDTGFQPLSREYGLDVPLGNGGMRARVVLTPLLSTWVFRRDGLLYTVLSNLHYETLYRELALRWGAGEQTSTERKSP